ncbi:hypothetical protein GALMADRAFT_217400 [Galerina marginata CBS 339.88]|uniref:Glycerophosphocholine acyltransferase 1 n=1 Tax=Galerina marginata (strain CBS 339.88) TaxID=685588 RepID=A0A067SDD9_GALM3|nr:hypothetical protein GALMADRAFT_217400 [Galerina marginata CBS 339.88]
MASGSSPPASPPLVGAISQSHSSALCGTSPQINQQAFALSLPLLPSNTWKFICISPDADETYFDSHIDLLQWRLLKHSDELKLKAEAAFRISELKLKIKDLSGVLLAENLERDIKSFKLKERNWHSFLFGLCYYVTILNFLFFWVFPSSPTLFVASYFRSHGSVASAVITWRNTLVFHDRDKVTTLFIHIYPPFSFTVISHFNPNVEERCPALAAVTQLNPWRALLLSSVLYAIGKLLYWKFVFVNRRAKIESGQRTTSLTYLLNDKRGAIGRALAAIPRAGAKPPSWVGSSVLYAILTELPVVFFYDSAACSAGLLLLVFSVSVWNGGGIYIEVFGRKFERELEAPRKEIAASAERAASASPSSSPPAGPYRLDPGVPSQPRFLLMGTKAYRRSPALIRRGWASSFPCLYYYITTPLTVTL